MRWLLRQASLGDLAVQAFRLCRHGVMRVDIRMEARTGVLCWKSMPTNGLSGDEETSVGGSCLDRADASATASILEAALVRFQALEPREAAHEHLYAAALYEGSTFDYQHTPATRPILCSRTHGVACLPKKVSTFRQLRDLKKQGFDIYVNCAKVT